MATAIRTESRLRLAYGAGVLVLVPWTFALAFVLPPQHTTNHYRLAWVGFDVGLAAVMSGTLGAIARRPLLVPVLAGMTGILLVCDAWFDVVTASNHGEFTLAVVLAALAEVPMALLCFRLAFGRSR